MSEARKWKIIEHSWRNTSIENEDGRIVCELDLESFDDLDENNQDKYEQLQRADAELIASAPALRDERDRLAELVRQAQPHVCSLLCPSVKARHELWTHTKLCLNMQAALTPAGGGQDGHAEVR